MSRVKTSARCRLLGLGALAALPTLGCDAGAVGVDTCLQIESARCEAAARCGDRFDVDSVAACKRFYKDQCLHGMAIHDEPGVPTVKACVQTIEGLRDCARKDGPKAARAKCAAVVSQDEDHDLVCDFVEQPELLDACAFLMPPADSGSAGAAGSAGSAGDAGSAGAAGSAGSAGSG